MKTSIYVPDYNNTISIPLLGDLDLDLDLLGILFSLTRYFRSKIVQEINSEAKNAKTMTYTISGKLTPPQKKSFWNYSILQYNTFFIPNDCKIEANFEKPGIWVQTFNVRPPPKKYFFILAEITLNNEVQQAKINSLVRKFNRLEKIKHF